MGHSIFTYKRRSSLTYSTSHILLLLGGVCSRRLGLISGGIRDFQLGGSGAKNKNLFDYGRLYHGRSGWCSDNAGQNYFEVKQREAGHRDHFYVVSIVRLFVCLYVYPSVFG